MLLIVVGPRIPSDLAAAWPAIAAARKHPRTGAPLQPAVTRLDLLWEAFSPKPPAWQTAPAFRRLMRELIRATFPIGPRVGLAFDPVGPPDGKEPLRTLTDEMRRAGDPAQRPLDPRLWLVLAPELPPELEPGILSTFLRAEPFARVARGDVDAAREVDRLLAGEGLASLVTNLEGEGTLALGDERARTHFFEQTAALEDLYATKEWLAPGEVYNRFHSHTGSEEIYIVLEGEGKIRVNERLLPIRAGQCFGKPRGYDCATQIVNTGTVPMVFLDIGTFEPSEVDLCRYPEHGEMLARFAGHRWIVPTEAVLPSSALAYDLRYFRRK